MPIINIDRLRALPCLCTFGVRFKVYTLSVPNIENSVAVHYPYWKGNIRALERERIMTEKPLKSFGGMRSENRLLACAFYLLCSGIFEDRDCVGEKCRRDCHIWKHFDCQFQVEEKFDFKLGAWGSWEPLDAVNKHLAGMTGACERDVHENQIKMSFYKR